MVSAKVKVNNQSGLHMHPAQLFVGAVSRFGCDVVIRFNGREINGKSIMNLLSAGIKKGTELEIKCTGDREESCLKAAVDLIAGLKD